MFNKIRNSQFTVISIIAYTLTAGTIVHAEDIPPIDCMIEPNIMVEISAPVDGVLDTLVVDRSDEVKEGEVVATLKSDIERVAVNMSKERLKLRQIEYKRAQGLYRKKAITLTEKDRLDNEKNLAELDLQHAEASLDLRKIRSPIDGVVVKRYSSPGEFVESNPIIKLAQLDPLKIEVVSPVSNYGKIEIGMRAKILPDFGGYQDLVAEVVVVDKVIDAASGTFGIRLELPNKDHSIPSGLKCKVRFMPKTKQTATVEEMPEEIISSEEVIVPVSQIITEKFMCLSVGPYKEQSVLNDLIDKLGSDIKQTALRSDTKTKTTYLVTSELFNTPEEAKDIMRSMKEAGFIDIAVMNKNGKHRLALGLYRWQPFARERVEAFKNKGYNVYMRPVNKEVNTYWADIAYLPQSASVLNNVIPETHRTVCDEAIKLTLLK